MSQHAITAAAQGIAAERVRFARLQSIATRHGLPEAALTQAIQRAETPAAFEARVPQILAEARDVEATQLAGQIAAHLPKEAALA